MHLLGATAVDKRGRFPCRPAAVRLVLILVTGCPRSGTYYTAALLQHVELDVRHEQVGKDGTVSWMLAVDAPTYPYGHVNERRSDYDFAQVVHLVRHPLDAIASITTIGTESWDWIAEHCPPVRVYESKWERAACFWWHWNQLCRAQADSWVQLESLPDLPGLPRNGRRHGPLEWPDLLRMEWGGACSALGGEYGYDDPRY